MQFGEEFIEELKDRIRLSDVIGRHVKLKRQGREYVGLSPFTNEKTPSFFVNDEKGVYHCFSSGKYGSAIGFLMDVERLSFPEAVEKLADKAGMALPEVDPEAVNRARQNKITINWMEEAQAFFFRSLHLDSAKNARDYLKSRGLSDEDVKRFGIGFAPDSYQALKNALARKGAPMEKLVEAGLVCEPDDKSRTPWDRFRNRIMFPIHDSRGRLVAFGGRAMDEDAKAKYLNSPETLIFRKSRVLYRYPEARKALSTPKNPARGLIVAEGYMDVIALAKAGFDHAVAPLGTALTEDQLDLLWRAGPEPTLCFDGDAAGLRAAYRSVERAIPKLEPNQTLWFALLPDGQDPDDLIREKGASAMQAVLDKSVPLIDLLWQKEQGAKPLDTPEARAGLKGRIFADLRTFTHDEVRKQYQLELLARFDQAFGRRSRGQNDVSRPTQYLSAQDRQAMAPSALLAAREAHIIGVLVEWPDMIEYLDEQIFELTFTTETAQKIQESLLSYWRDTKSVEKSTLHTHMERQGLDGHLRRLRKNRRMTLGVVGGREAKLDTRLTLWRHEASALAAFYQRDRAREDARSRLENAVREDNAEQLKSLMRSSRRIHD
ncbi:MAG: DNA primase [Hyphomonadaceae bacterium]|nr:DNA primase [Hyphomonadaceae bacterium]